MTRMIIRIVIALPSGSAGWVESEDESNLLGRLLAVSTAVFFSLILELSSLTSFNSIEYAVQPRIGSSSTNTASVMPYTLNVTIRKVGTPLKLNISPNTKQPI